MVDDFVNELLFLFAKPIHFKQFSPLVICATQHHVKETTAFWSKPRNRAFVYALGLAIVFVSYVVGAPESKKSKQKTILKTGLEASTTTKSEVQKIEPIQSIATQQDIQTTKDVLTSSSQPKNNLSIPEASVPESGVSESSDVEEIPSSGPTEASVPTVLPQNEKKTFAEMKQKNGREIKSTPTQTIIPSEKLSNSEKSGFSSGLGTYFPSNGTKVFSKKESVDGNEKNEASNDAKYVNKNYVVSKPSITADPVFFTKDDLINFWKKNQSTDGAIGFLIDGGSGLRKECNGPMVMDYNETFLSVADYLKESAEKLSASFHDYGQSGKESLMLNSLCGRSNQIQSKTEANNWMIFRYTRENCFKNSDGISRDKTNKGDVFAIVFMHTNYNPQDQSTKFGRKLPIDICPKK